MLHSTFGGGGTHELHQRQAAQHRIAVLLDSINTALSRALA
jgi:hypothetical protein